MSEPSGAYTFERLLLDVAEYVGIANYDATTGQRYLPTDKYDLGFCKRIVNGGVRMFMDDQPRKGWRWMRRIASVTFDSTGGGANNIDSDAARYLLPANFGGTTDGKITYSSDSGTGQRIEWCDESRIRNARAINVQSGTPSLAAIRRYQPTDENLSSRRWELIVDPEPSSNYTVEFPYTLYFDDMKMETGIADSTSTTTLVDATRYEPDDCFNDWIITIISGTGRGSYAVVTDYTAATGTFTVADWLDANGNAGGTDPDTDSIYRVEPADNLHPAGFEYDEVILAACMARAESDPNSDDLGDKWTGLYYKKYLPSAKAKDERSAPRKMGYCGDGEVDFVYERNWSNVTTDHDV